MRLKDGTPFIVFEYVEGQDVEHLIQAGQLSLEQAVQMSNKRRADWHTYTSKGSTTKTSSPQPTLTNSGVQLTYMLSLTDEETVSAGTVVTF